MSAADDDLDELRHHWDTAYVINRAGDLWIAQRRDTRETLRADTVEGLYALIHADYERNPVPRQP